MTSGPAASSLPVWTADGEDLIVEADNLEYIRTLPDESFRVIYIDPPFNTGRTQRLQSLKTKRSDTGTRVGFKGQTYETIRSTLHSYDDAFTDYWSFLEPRLFEAWRLLTPDGTLYLHLDYREVHYAKVMLDAMFGRDSFLNEIIWAYDYGARSTSRWPAKHDNILVYVKDPQNYVWNGTEVDREPYMAPSRVTAEKVALGKLPTDVWWHTIVPTGSKERTGYATQKPVGIVRRMLQASSHPGDWVLDYFAGSGTTGAAARELGRRFVLVDSNPEAIRVMARRLASAEGASPVTVVADQLPDDGEDGAAGA